MITRKKVDKHIFPLKVLKYHIIFSVFSCSIDGTIVDTTHLVCLYLLAKLLQAELEKCLRLVKNLPMQDMDSYLGKNHFSHI